MPSVIIICLKIPMPSGSMQVSRHCVIPTPLLTHLDSGIDIVHVVTFAIILLNTDLQTPELNTHMTNSQFVENTVETIRRQMQEHMGLNSPGLTELPSPEPLPDIDELAQPQSPVSPVPQSPTTPTLTRTSTSSPPNVERRTAQNRKRLSSIGSVPFINRDSWVLELHSYDTGEPIPDPPAVLEERWIADITRELSVSDNPFNE